MNKILKRKRVMFYSSTPDLKGDIPCDPGCTEGLFTVQRLIQVGVLWMCG